MLELKILKVNHSGKDNAKKLIPYIENCDIFGMESGCATKEHAEEIESHWEYMLQTNKSVARLKIELEEVKYSDKSIHPDEIEFEKQLDIELYKFRKPIIVLERFSKLESKFLESLYSPPKTRSLLLEGNIDGFVSAYWNGLKMQGLADKQRDIHIAQNISKAEEKIRRKFEKLSEKNSINLSIMIGKLHNIERYLNCPYEVIDLHNENSIFLELARKAYEDNIPFEEVKKDLLAAGLKASFKIPDRELDLPFERLKELAASLSNGR